MERDPCLPEVAGKPVCGDVRRRDDQRVALDEFGRTGIVIDDCRSVCTPILRGEVR
jgi:hypothetical protein